MEECLAAADRMVINTNLPFKSKKLATAFLFAKINGLRQHSAKIYRRFSIPYRVVVGLVIPSKKTREK